MARRLAACAAVGLAALAATLGVAYAASPLPTLPNDPLFVTGPQWGLTMVGAPLAWPTSTAAGVTIGIVDSGVDLTHQDLAAHIVASTDCIGSDGDPSRCSGTGQDDNGHGTLVAGIADAVTNNNVGIAGMAPDARIVSAKVIDASGNASLADVDAGIEWVVDHGATVVNLSLGDANLTLTSTFGVTVLPAIEDAWNHGAIPVLAAGNAGALGLATTSASGTSSYVGGPNGLDAVVVGAVGVGGQPASYSSPTDAAKWALMAPGGSADGVQQHNIVSTYWVSGEKNQYGYAAGTDMAAPFVSGTLALLMGTGLTAQQAVNHLLSSVSPLSSCGPDTTNCHGLLNAAQAVAGLSAAHTSGTTSDTAPVSPPSSLPSASVPSTVAPSSGPSTTLPPAVVSKPGKAPPTPTTVRGAPPAVMVPGPRSGSPPTTTRSGSATKQSAAAPQPTVEPKGVHGDGRTVGIEAIPRHHGRAIGWFVLLAAGFALLVALGVVRTFRTTAEL